MMRMNYNTLFVVFTSFLLVACQPNIEADVVIENGDVFVGDNKPAQHLTVAIKDDEIIYIGADNKRITAKTTIDATGLYVIPGFIDPHTHSLDELQNDDAEMRENRNYQFQGVTTVVNGNDGYGEPNIVEQIQSMSEAGIGTNTALFIGHGALRTAVMGGDKRAPTPKELAEMKSIIRTGMQAGALGLSTGLFYAPGSFSNTEEVIELAKIAAEFNGVYDSHIRDEASYNIGLEAAIDEVIEIAREADIHGHVAHIKALGVDVWGKSDTLIAKIEAAQAEGISLTADQYPWRASGTRISNALLPRWVKAGSHDDYMARLNDPDLKAQIIEETAENLRRRGGPEAVLITQTNPEWQGRTLGELAKINKLSPVDMAISIALNGDARIASFNMSPDDIHNFMKQEWVMTSSDGSNGHPRKYASYPKKYRDYVVKENILPIETFFYQSSGLVADTFRICDRGYLKKDYKADIAIIDPDSFAPVANFHNAAVLSKGVEYLIVNGQFAIKDAKPVSSLSGSVIRRCEHKN